MIDLRGKRVLVAGGTGTVGRYLVKAQLAAGASVVVPSRQQAKLDALAAGVDPAHRGRLFTIAGDITDGRDAPRLLENAEVLDGAVASLGGFIGAPSVLAAPRADLERAMASYTFAHFSAAQALLPALEERGGGYVMINGSLAFDPDFPGTGLVSIATAAQTMMARVLMKERAGLRTRINEVVIYSSLGRGNDEANEVKGTDIGGFVSYLVSDAGVAVKGQIIHLRTRRDLEWDEFHFASSPER